MKREDKKVNQIINLVYNQKTETVKTINRIKKNKEDNKKHTKRNRVKEKKILAKFKEIIENKQYFRTEHFEQIDVPFDWLIHLSAKNAGKTTEIMRLITRTIERGEKFMFGRVYADELAREQYEFERREDSPVRMLLFRNTWFFFTKKDINEFIESKTEKDENGVIYVPDVTYRNLRKAGYEEVGRGMTFYKSNCLSSGAYEKYTAVIFDEILSYNPKNRINKKVLDAWDASANTIQRNKPNLKYYLFGNLQEVAEHPFLAHYGIDIDDELRYINRGKGCNILFVNSKGLYKNTIGHKSGASQHTSEERGEFLANNIILKPHPNILNNELYETMNKRFSLVDYQSCGYCLITMRQLKDESGEINCVNIEPLTHTTLIDEIAYSNDLNAINLNDSVKYRLSLESYHRLIRRLFKYKKLYFSNNITYERFKEFIFNTNYVDNINMELIA